jgi:endonuclease/exonuclease/phosphatase family metal-dependent hydrolase
MKQITTIIFLLLTIITFSQPAPGQQKTTSNETEAVTFLQFNIWQEGTSVPNGMQYIKDVIAEVEPDIVSFSEVRNYDGDWTTKIVNLLAKNGLNYFRGYLPGADVSVISKYPITSSGPLLEDAISVFEIAINKTRIVVAAAHLDYTHYACYLPRGYNCGGSAPYSGWKQIGSPNPQPVTSVSDISAQNMASKRDEQIAAFLSHYKTEEKPIILLGDFNEPSCLDWTDKQATLFDHNSVVFQWQTTKALKENGYTDAFREIYPDEVLNPGITWPAVATGVGTTSWTPKSDERDRIDYIFYKGTNVLATSAVIVGPKASYVKNVVDTSYTKNEIFLADEFPWPSDHKALFVTINIPSVNTAIDETENKKIDIKIFPNPSTGIFHLKVENQYFSYNIINANGTLIKSNRSCKDSSLIDLSGYKKGIYLLNIKANKKTVTRKLIIE